MSVSDPPPQPSWAKRIRDKVEDKAAGWVVSAVIGAVSAIFVGVFMFGRNYDTLVVIPQLPQQVRDLDAKAREADASLAALKQKLDEQNQMLGALSTTVSSLASSKLDSNSERTIVPGDLQIPANRWGEPETYPVSNRDNDARCPVGQVVVGVRGIDTDGGGYCVECLTQIKLICRPL